MFGQAQFARMKPTAYFVNTARGGIHDEHALASALRAKTIAGAGLDVFLVEPPSADHPLLAFENVIATPHTAGVTAESLHNLARSAATQLIELFAGKVPPRLVNPEAWPRYAARLARMKRTAFLINVGRGELIDREALVAALEAKTIAGAGLDVYWQEPIDPGDELLSMPNVVATPHVGGPTEDALQRIADQVVAIIRETVGV